MTGAAGGLGREIVERLLAGRTPVAAWDVNAPDFARPDDELLQTRAVDVRDRDAVFAAAADAHARFGVVAGLSACAGIFRPKPFLDLDENDWNLHFDVNLKGALFACQAALPFIARAKERLDRAVVVEPRAPRRSRTRAITRPPKAASLGLMRVLALEVARDGVRVNAVSPGLTDTLMPRAVFTDEALSARAAENPMGRLGAARDMAEAALFLLGPESSYVTGQDIRVNGGEGLF